jgi:hypothetical protein
MDIAIVAKVETWQRTLNGFKITFSDGSSLDIVDVKQPQPLIGKNYDLILLDPLADDHTKLLVQAATAAEGKVETL